MAIRAFIHYTEALLEVIALKSTERTYRFPANLQLERFMNSFNNWSGYTLNGFYSSSSKHGDLEVVQALPFARARVPWRIEGTTVYFDFAFAMMHFEPRRMEKIYDHLLEQANLFGAGLSRSAY